MNPSQSIFFSSKGSVVEMSITLLLFISLTFFGSVSVYLKFANYWIEIQLYEAAICLEEWQGPATCKRKLEQKINQALPIGKINKIKLHRRPRIVTADLSWTCQNWKIKKYLKIKKTDIYTKSDIL